MSTSSGVVFITSGMHLGLSEGVLTDQVAGRLIFRRLVHRKMKIVIQEREKRK